MMAAKHSQLVAQSQILTSILDFSYAMDTKYFMHLLTSMIGVHVNTWKKKKRISCK